MERDLHVYEKRPTHMWQETKEIEIGRLYIQWLLSCFVRMAGGGGNCAVSRDDGEKKHYILTSKPQADFWEWQVGAGKAQSVEMMPKNTKP